MTLYLYCIGVAFVIFVMYAGLELFWSIRDEH